jgi:hypothetical protein
MKYLFIAFFLAISLNTFSQSDSLQTGKVYFIRSIFDLSLKAFKLFIDSTFVCKLDENRYSVHDVTTGKHYFSVQLAGKKSKKKAERIPIDIKAGQSYYIELVFQKTAFFPNLYCIEVTENSALPILNKLKQDNNCKK